MLKWTSTLDYDTLVIDCGYLDTRTTPRAWNSCQCCGKTPPWTMGLSVI